MKGFIIIFSAVHLVTRSSAEELAAGKVEIRTLTVVGTSVPFKTALAGYEPATLVTDQSLLDLDQGLILKALGFNSFSDARRVYEQGAHSLSVATVTLGSLVTVPLQAGSLVVGTTTSGNTLRASMYKDVVPGATDLQILYLVSPEVGRERCQVGGSFIPVLDGCLAVQGNITVGGQTVLKYKYNPNANNNNERTIQSLSTGEAGVFQSCKTCPPETYQSFVNYYGDYTYGDELISAAFQGIESNMQNGNVDFSAMDISGRAKFVGRATVLLNIWMMVIGLLDLSLEACQGQDTNGAVHNWDQAVAFYVGSEEDKLLYKLADDLCLEFGTCGADDVTLRGTSQANIHIFKAFEEGQADLLQGSCEPVVEQKNRIVQLMTIPLIQGALMSAHALAGETTDDSQRGEAAAFAAAILPLVTDCSAVAGSWLLGNLQVGQTRSADDFVNLKQALQNSYDCLGVTCEDVGGIVDETGGYVEGAEACGLPNKASDPNTSGDSSYHLVLTWLVLVICPFLSAILQS